MSDFQIDTTSMQYVLKLSPYRYRQDSLLFRSDVYINHIFLISIKYPVTANELLIMIDKPIAILHNPLCPFPTNLSLYFKSILQILAKSLSNMPIVIMSLRWSTLKL